MIMEEKRKHLIAAIQLQLEKNDHSRDTTFYSIDEWKEREEPYHNDSEFVIITEGALFEILNFGYEQQAEFEDLVLSFDFFYELGSAWNLGFYYDQVPQKEVKFKTYSEKLRDQRWIDKRDLVKSNANDQCQDCGSTHRLEVHHCLPVWQGAVGILSRFIAMFMQELS